MRKVFFIAAVLAGLSSSALAFNSTAKDTSLRKTRILSVGGGFIKTSLNFFKNAQENTYSNGWGARMMLQTSETFRFAACFSKVESVNINPTWVNVKNSFFDLDAHFMMHFADKRSIAYFLMGLSGQYWNGYYTGLHDLNNWKLHATANTMYQALYFGGRMGIGAEIKIFGPLNGYGEFIFRFSKTDVGSGLSDVVYGLGLKMNVANLSRHHRNNKHRHSILKFRDKYHWF